MKAALEKEIFDSITEFVDSQNFIFKSVRCKKDNDGILSGIALEFDWDDIPSDVMEPEKQIHLFKKSGWFWWVTLVGENVKKVALLITDGPKEPSDNT